MMSANELAAIVKALKPEHRQVVEALVALLSEETDAKAQPDLTNHPSFGAWANRRDLPADTHAAARELRKRAGRRESA
jgi:hypothetical protein